MKKFLTIATIAIAFMTLTSCGSRSSKAATDNDAGVVDTAVVDTAVVDTAVVDTVVVE